MPWPIETELASAAAIAAAITEAMRAVALALVLVWGSAPLPSARRS
jgi:hypothetical protein